MTDRFEIKLSADLNLFVLEKAKPREQGAPKWSNKAIGPLLRRLPQKIHYLTTSRYRMCLLYFGSYSVSKSYNIADALLSVDILACVNTSECISSLIQLTVTKSDTYRGHFLIIAIAESFIRHNCTFIIRMDVLLFIKTEGVFMTDVKETRRHMILNTN